MEKEIKSRQADCFWIWQSEDDKKQAELLESVVRSREKEKLKEDLQRILRNLGRSNFLHRNVVENLIKELEDNGEEN